MFCIRTPVLSLFGLLAVVPCAFALQPIEGRIQPYKKNSFYFQYQGKPVLLVGGSVEDNLFQISDLEAHLDLLASVGGNYVRCTMSSRDEGNLWPFSKDSSSGLYDLEKPHQPYWERFSSFLKLTSDRNIIVQIEVWATFDFYRENWQRNPFNPKNNTNYTQEESGLPTEVKSHPTRTENPFFWSIPAEDNNRVVLDHQRAFVDELLSFSLNYTHVLYCMDNETSVTPEWGRYWATHIRDRALQRGLKVEVTEMWDPWDLSHPMHGNTFEHPDIYTFVDISQNNHQRGEDHWNNAQSQRKRIAESHAIRPLTNVKIYGADRGRFGSDRDGIERFWRNLFGGLASARFHRPPSGLGLSLRAQTSIRSLRMLGEYFDFFSSIPVNERLLGRASNEAYCVSDADGVTAVFFPDAGSVRLAPSQAEGESYRIRWLNVSNSEWTSVLNVSPKGPLLLETPSPGYWIAVVDSPQ